MNKHLYQVFSNSFSHKNYHFYYDKNHYSITDFDIQNNWYNDLYKSNMNDVCIINFTRNGPLNCSIITSNKKYLFINIRLKKAIAPNSIPVGTKHIVFNSIYEFQLTNGVIPSSVTHLTLYTNCRLKPGSLHIGLKHINLGKIYNKPLQKGVIPHGVTDVILGNAFDQPLEEDIFPNTVIHIVLGDAFDQPLEYGGKSVIPFGVKYLTLGKAFSQQILQNSIPDSVIYLNIISPFKFENIDCIPSGIKVLLFSNVSDFNSKINFSKFKNLVYIKFGNSYKYPIDCDSMPNILFIEIGNDYDISNIINLSNKNITIFRRGFFWHGYASHFTRDPSFLLISETKIVDIYLSTQLMLYMADIVMNKKYIHSGLHQEMVNKVLNPMRLKCICDEYNISFYDLIKNYYL